jgi:pyruvate dehydrogenase complex dehydrogenase (E1) component
MSGDHNMYQNDFKPDWDTVKAYDEKFSEMLDEIGRLRVELKQSNGRLHDVAKHCAEVEASLKGVNTAAMNLTCDLTCMEVDNDDRLDRDRVMERVMQWRNEWDKAMFELRPKRGQDIGGHMFNAARVAAQRQWVGLTTGEAREFYESDLSREELIHKIDEFLQEKNT